MKTKLLALLKNPNLYLILFCGALLAMSTRHVLSTNSTPHSLIILIIIALLYLGILWAFFYLRRKQVPLEKIFLLLAVPLGVLFIIFLPPGESPDEIMHFKRAYSITEGYFIAETYDDFGHAGAKLPSGFQTSLVEMPEHGAYATVIERLSEPVSSETSYVPFNNTALYYWLSYLPQVVGVLFGKAVGASLELIAYFAEIVDFIVWLVLIYFSIKLIPKFKQLLLFFSLLPITLQEATSLAPDALAIGLGLFLTSYVCYLIYTRQTRLKPLEIALLYLVAILVGYCKIVYLPLVALYLLIPAKRFGSPRAKWIHASILIIALLALNLSWLATSSRFLVEFNAGVNPGEQLAGILHNPLRYLMVLFNSLNTMGEFYLTSLLGINLGSFTFNLPTIFFFLSFVLLVLLFAQRDEAIKITPFERLVFGGVFCLVALLVFTSIYIQWSPVNLPFVDGVQGRYFLPIILLIPLTIAPYARAKSTAVSRPSLVSLNTIVCYALTTNLLAVTMFFAQNL